MIQKPGLEDCAANGETIFIGQDVIVAQYIPFTIRLNHRAESASHHVASHASCELKSNGTPGPRGTSPSLPNRNHRRQCPEASRLHHINRDPLHAGGKFELIHDQARRELPLNIYPNGELVGLMTIFDLLSDANPNNVVLRSRRRGNCGVASKWSAYQ